MKFIEILFQLSPDNNTGTIELQIIFALCAVLLGVWYFASARAN